MTDPTTQSTATEVAETSGFKQENPVDGDFVISLVLWLALLLAACFVVLKAFRHKISAATSGKTDSRLKVEETLRLSSKTLAYLISVDGETIVVVESSANTNLCNFSSKQGKAISKPLSSDND